MTSWRCVSLKGIILHNREQRGSSDLSVETVDLKTSKQLILAKVYPCHIYNFFFLSYISSRNIPPFEVFLFFKGSVVLVVVTYRATHRISCYFDDLRMRLNSHLSFSRIDANPQKICFILSMV